MSNPELQDRFFNMMQSFHRLHFDRLFTSISKMEFFALRSLCALHYKSKSDTPIYVSDLTKHMHLFPSAISRLLKGLESKGYIVRKVDPNNRRNTIIQLTQEGEDLAKQLQGRMQTYVDQVFEKMEDKDMEELLRLSNKLFTCMQEELDTYK